MQRTALIIDDDRDLLDILGRYLSGHGFSVTSASDGAEGLAILKDSRHDIVVTDAEMPGMDGFSFCKKLKESGSLAAIPVIIMSGKRTTEGDMLSGYDRGSDDYVIKPFSYPVLLAKISAIIKRTKTLAQPGPATIKKHGFELDIQGRALTVASRPVRLTSKEFNLFALLVSAKGRVLSLSQLLEGGWSYDPARQNNPHTVEVHISNLRKKLGPRLSARVKAVPGYGYKFE